MTSHVRHRGTTKVLLYHFFRTKYDEISNNDSYYKINVDIYMLVVPFLIWNDRYWVYRSDNDITKIKFIKSIYVTVVGIVPESYSVSSGIYLSPLHEFKLIGWIPCFNHFMRSKMDVSYLYIGGGHLWRMSLNLSFAWF